MSRRPWPKGWPSIRLETQGDLALCICRVCLPYSIGTDAATLAYDEGLADPRPILRLLEDHGTVRRVYRGGSKRRKAAAGPPLLALLLALLLPFTTHAKGHGPVMTVRPPSAAVEAQTNPVGWPLPSEIIRTGLTLAGSVVTGATSEVILLALPLTGPGGRRYRAEMRREHEDGGPVWRVRFVPVDDVRRKMGAR